MNYTKATVILFICVVVSTIKAGDAATVLTAEQILSRMADTYAKCKSYRDSGVVKTLFFTKNGDHASVEPFNTAFSRPDRFRYEFTENEKVQYIVWSKGDEIKTWSFEEIENRKSISYAIAGATGVSSGSALTIPALLLREQIKAKRLTDLENPKLLKEAKIGEVVCFRVNGKLVNSDTTIWIERSSFLVLKIEKENKFDDFRTESTTTYKPVLNEKIAEDVFKFNPPVRSKK